MFIEHLQCLGEKSAGQVTEQLTTGAQPAPDPHDRLSMDVVMERQVFATLGNHASKPPLPERASVLA